MDNLFEFAADLSRAHAATLRDDPLRVAPPTYVTAGPDFEERPLDVKLDAAERLCRRDFYKEAVLEAFGEHERSASFTAMLLDSSVPREVVGQLATQMVLEYLQRCARGRGEDLNDFV